MINNPEYKGEWKPKQIKNPKYQVRIRLSEERDFTFQNILAPVEKIAKTENGRGFIHSPSNVCSVFLFVSYLLVATSMLHQAFISLWNLQTPIFILFILHLLEIAINVEKCAQQKVYWKTMPQQIYPIKTIIFWSLSYWDFVPNSYIPCRQHIPKE